MHRVVHNRGRPQKFYQRKTNNKKLRKEKAAVTKYKQPGKRLWKI